MKALRGKGDSCASNLDVPFDDREHHIQIESPLSSSGKDIGLRRLRRL
jgi:hypothetical protein